LFGFGCCLVAAWSPFGFRSTYVWLLFGFRSILVGLVLVLLVLACLLPFGYLVVRSSGPVLDSVDDLLDAWFACFACLVC
jgi:fumarate reductase subunit D